MDRQLLSMMSENSVDFTSKFAKLASAVVGSNVEDTWLIPKIPQDSLGFPRIPQKSPESVG